MAKPTKAVKSKQITPFALLGLVIMGILLVVLYYAAQQQTNTAPQAALTCGERCNQKVCNSIKDKDKQTVCVEKCEAILCGFVQTCEQKCETNVTCSKLTGDRKTGCINQCKQNKCTASYGEVQRIAACEKRCDDTACNGVKDENKPACIARCKAQCRL